MHHTTHLLFRSVSPCCARRCGDRARSHLPHASAMAAGAAAEDAPESFSTPTWRIVILFVGILLVDLRALRLLHGPPRRAARRALAWVALQALGPAGSAFGCTPPDHAMTSACDHAVWLTTSQAVTASAQACRVAVSVP